MSLSVVMICHNEEANLPRTLASLAPLLAEPVNDLIVVNGNLVINPGTTLNVSRRRRRGGRPLPASERIARTRCCTQRHYRAMGDVR